MDLPTHDDVRAAAARLQGVAHRTPVLCSRTADALCGASLFFKCENLQRAGAFKFRGAYNAIAALPDAQRRRGVVAFSSGNHAQSIAYAARLLDVPATLVMPRDAPVAKLAATRGYGGEVIQYDRRTEDRQAIGERLAAERGLALIPPYDHADVIAGQGTAALELFDEVEALDLVISCLGGGGLTGGTVLARDGVAPGCAVWGVEPEAGDDAKRSLAEGRIVHIDVPDTIADGAQTQHLGQLTFPLLQHGAAGVATVPDAALVQAMRFLFERMKLVVEPTGALAAAAAFTGAVPVAGRRVGVILTGGNVDLGRFAELMRPR